LSSEVSRIGSVAINRNKPILPSHSYPLSLFGAWPELSIISPFVLTAIPTCMPPKYLLFLTR
jgi:hypothetical protein